MLWINSICFMLFVSSNLFKVYHFSRCYPLLLSPYIESNRLNEAKDLSSVRFHEFLNIKSYSGFLTVNEKYDSNLFFWFFPSMVIFVCLLNKLLTSN